MIQEIMQGLLCYGAGVLFTVPIARRIYTTNMIKAIVNLGEMGYKLNGKLFDENGEYIVGKKNEMRHTFIKCTYYVPLFNILIARLMRKAYMEDVYMASEFSDALVPMTDEEQALFNSCKNDLDKLKVMVINMQIDGIKNQFANMHVDTCLRVKCAPVLPMSYSYDEVMKFKELDSNITFGNSNGRNVAFVGIDPDVDFGLTVYENISDIKYEFNKYTEEEAKDLRYVVYPCVDADEEQIDKIVNEIRDKRSSRIIIPSTINNNQEMISKPKKLTREK